MKRLVFCIAIVLLLSGTAGAMAIPTIASWDMYGMAGTESFRTGSGSDHVTAFDMVRGPGLTVNAGSNSLNSKGWDGTETGDYIEFGFTVAEGYEVDLTNLWIGTRASGTGPGTIGVYSSLDGYSTALFSITHPADTFVNSILDLEGLGAITGNFYIRLYEIGNTQADGSGDTAGTGTFRITDHYDGVTSTYTDVQFTGVTTNPVPIPAAAWLLGSGLIAILGIRRKN